MVKIYLLLLISFLVACSSPEPIVKAADPKDDPKIAVGAGFTKAKPTTSTQSLLDAAIKQQRAGLFKQAEATVERALRLHPNQYEAWSLLVTLHLQQKNWQTAEQLANKVLVQLGAKDYRRREVWNQIAKAREGAGNIQAAKQAKQKAMEY